MVTPLATLSTVAALAWYLLSPPARGYDNWTLMVFVSLAALLSLASYLAIRLRSFSIRSGIMTLPLPVRMKSGGRVQLIEIGQIATVMPVVVRNATGLKILLRDGSSFAIADSALPPGAREYLLNLGSRTQ